MCVLLFGVVSPQITKKWEYALSKEIPQDLNAVSVFYLKIYEIHTGITLINLQTYKSDLHLISPTPLPDITLHIKVTKIEKNNHQLKQLLIVKQILHGSTLGNV